MDPISFWLGGAITLASGVMMVTRRHAVASVMWLVLAFLGMSVLFIGMDAGFIGVIQILVYAGAILVLFLFVIMLLNLTPSAMARRDRPGLKVVGLLASVAFIGVIVSVVVGTPLWTDSGTEAAILARMPDVPLADGTLEPATSLTQGTVLSVADQLFNSHLLPFEVASVLLLVAIIGAVALTKKRL